MRAELAAAVGGLLANLPKVTATADPLVDEKLLRAADLVTLARTAVERDHKGDVVNAHAPEMPTRFAKMLGQVHRGMLTIGADRQRALATALRVASDSIPPLRLQILTDVNAHAGTRLSETLRRVQRPRTTVDRELQALHMLGLLHVQDNTPGGWCYTMAEGIDLNVLH
jgi:hypothetical protein